MTSSISLPAGSCQEPSASFFQPLLAPYRVRPSAPRHLPLKIGTGLRA